jgi:hypothetical protein
LAAFLAVFLAAFFGAALRDAAFLAAFLGAALRGAGLRVRDRRGVLAADGDTGDPGWSAAG